ncbi:hypothetical protein C3L33_09744, partial [Rhododendron williamsianum]
MTPFPGAFLPKTPVEFLPELPTTPLPVNRPGLTPNPNIHSNGRRPEVVAGKSHRPAGGGLCNGGGKGWKTRALRTLFALIEVNGPIGRKAYPVEIVQSLNRNSGAKHEAGYDAFMTGSLNWKSGAKHEAGYDAFMTGIQQRGGNPRKEMAAFPNTSDRSESGKINRIIDNLACGHIRDDEAIDSSYTCEAQLSK